MSEPAVTPALVEARLAGAGLTLEATQVALLARFLLLLQRWNRVYNLTGIHDARQLIDRHLVESLALRPLLAGRRIADVGTGAGVPGMPLAIGEPSRTFCLIESRAKRVRFLRHVQGELGLDNVAIEHGRVEDLSGVQPFDTVLARAVAPLAELTQLVSGITAIGGRLLVMTTPASVPDGAAAGGFVVERTVTRAADGRLAVVQLQRTE